MTIAIDRLGPTTLELGLVGTLDKNDYEMFTPHAEATIEKHGKMNLVVNIPEKPRFTPAALWEDLKFDVSHFGDVGRMALVSDDSSDEWLATISKPFTKADVKFFTTDQADAARDWAKRGRTE